MLYIAFTLGLFGSLHCVGMCGPLAMTFASGGNSRWPAIYSGLSYHMGRTVTYVGLGLLFGLVGNAMLLAGVQQWLSILVGVAMVLSFLTSVDVDTAIGRTYFGQQVRRGTTTLLNKIYAGTTAQPRVVLGMVNGLLPCGLVYLALAGSLASNTILEGGLFMLLFGLGTVPAMIALTIGEGLVSRELRLGFRKVLPYVTLCFGVFMIYRGLAVEMPAELDFWTAIKHPVMCH